MQQELADALEALEGRAAAANQVIDRRVEDLLTPDFRGDAGQVDTPAAGTSATGGSADSK